MVNRALGVCLALLASLSVSLGQGEDTNKTVVTADRLTFDYKKYTAIFENHVVVTDPRMNIESDRLTLIFNNTNEIKSVTAVGNVRLKSEDKTGTCNKAVYLAETEEVVLTGNARLKRGFKVASRFLGVDTAPASLTQGREPGHHMRLRLEGPLRDVASRLMALCAERLQGMA